jgi:hypothetical protein
VALIHFARSVPVSIFFVLVTSFSAAKRWDIEREYEDSSMLGNGGLGRDGID